MLACICDVGRWWLPIIIYGRRLRKEKLEGLTINTFLCLALGEEITKAFCVSHWVWEMSDWLWSAQSTCLFLNKKIFITKNIYSLHNYICRSCFTIDYLHFLLLENMLSRFVCLFIICINWWSAPWMMIEVNNADFTPSHCASVISCLYPEVHNLYSSWFYYK